MAGGLDVTVAHAGEGLSQDGLEVLAGLLLGLVEGAQVARVKPAGVTMGVTVSNAEPAEGRTLERLGALRDALALPGGFEALSDVALGFVSAGSVPGANPGLLVGDRHVLELRDDGWGLQHPLKCRPALLDCPIHRAVGDTDMDAFAAGARGRFVLGLHEQDGLILEEDLG